METLKNEGFEMPTAEIVIFDAEDVITASAPGDDNETPLILGDW